METVLDFKDVMIVVTLLSIIVGSFLTALGIWEIKRQKKHA